MNRPYTQPDEETPILMQIINHIAHREAALGSLIGNIGGGSSDAKREGWNDISPDPEDFPLGPACDLSGEGKCEACE